MSILIEEKKMSTQSLSNPSAPSRSGVENSKLLGNGSEESSIPSYPDKRISDPITLNDFYSSLHYSEDTLSEKQRDAYKMMEVINYCNQQAIKIVGDAKMGQVHFIERLCSLNLLKGSECLKKYVSFNAEETPNRLNASRKDYGQFYYNLMHCQDHDSETNNKFKEFLQERELFSNNETNKLMEVFPRLHENLTLKNMDLAKEAFSKVDPNSEDRTFRLNEELRKRIAQPQYDNLRKCANERYFKKYHDDETFGLKQNDVNVLAHKCFVPYMEYFTRMGTIICRRQFERCLSFSAKKHEHNIANANFFYFNSCMNDDPGVAECMRFTEKYFIDNLDE